MIRILWPRISIAFSALILLCGCGVCHHSDTGGRSVPVANSGNRDDESRKGAPTLESFVDAVKKSFTARELKEAAIQFFRDHPGFDGNVPDDQWPAILKVRKETIYPPFAVSANSNSERDWSMTIEYERDASRIMGLYIISSGETKTPDVWRGLGEHTLKWVNLGPGVYLYYMHYPLASEYDPKKARQKTLKSLETFLHTVKQSFTAQELREAASRFFQTHPNFEGPVPQEQWPEIFKLRKETIHQPAFVIVFKGDSGEKELNVVYYRTFFQMGISIVPDEAREMSNSPDSTTTSLKWEQGIYVYSGP